MKTLFDRQANCCFCHQDKSCSGAFVYQAKTAGAAPRLYPDPLDQRTRDSLSGTGQHADLFICEECAAKQGKKPVLLWVLWAVALIMTWTLFIPLTRAGSARIGATIMPLTILMYTYIICGIILVVKAGIPSVGLRILCIILAFSPFGALMLLLLMSRINKREQVRTALQPQMAQALKASVPTDPENEELVHAIENELKRQITGDLFSDSGTNAANTVPAAPAQENISAPADVPKAPEPEKRGPGNTFYVFIVEGRGFGRATDSMPRELAEQLQGDYPGSSGMRLQIVEDYQWSGKADTQESSGMFTSSAGIKDQIPGIRTYLKKLDLSDEVIDAGIAELESRKLQRVNPFGGVFAFGVPIESIS